MKLPNLDMLLVEREKVADYILNASHPENGGKAEFFISLGFGRSNWNIFADALRKLASRADITESMESKHGWKYIVDGRIESPGGKKPLVRTVWIIDRGADTPRLVTAYPLNE